MPDDRELPPTPRRRALARAAGLVAHAPHLTAGAAWFGALGGVAWVANHDGGRWRQAMRAAATAADGTSGAAIHLGEVPAAVLAITVPMLAGATLAAVAAHVVQTRGVWLPMRHLVGAPATTSDAGRRAGDAVRGLVRGAVVLAAIAVWLGRAAPQLARLGEVPAAQWPSTIVQVTLAAGAVLAATIIVGGVFDFVVQTLRMRADLRMTPRERRDELAAAGPRRAPAQAHTFAGEHVGASAIGAMRRAQVLLTDGTHALALSTPGNAPRLLAIGRGVDATQLLALARRYRVPITHTPMLVAALRHLPLGPLPPSYWPAMAEIVAANTATVSPTPRATAP